MAFDKSADALLQVDNLSKSFPVRHGFLGLQSKQLHAVSSVSFSMQ